MTNIEEILKYQKPKKSWLNGKAILADHVRHAIRFDVYPLLGHGYKKVLDVGCRTGEAIDIFRDFGWEAEGIELITEFVEIGRSKGRTITQGDVTFIDLYYPIESFDLLFGSHIIEHLVEPGMALKSMHRITRPNGYYVLLFPKEDKDSIVEEAHRSFFPNEETIRSIVPECWDIRRLEFKFVNWVMVLRARRNND